MTCNVFTEQDPTHRSLSRATCVEHGVLTGGYTMHVLAEQIAEEHLEQNKPRAAVHPLVEKLTAAAAEARRLAGAATPGPWEPYVLGSEGYDVRGPRADRPGRLARPVRVARCGYEEWETDKANAAHIATWSPATAGAVADLLAYYAEAHGWGEPAPYDLAEAIADEVLRGAS